MNGGEGDDYIDVSSNASLNTINAGAGHDTIDLQSMNNVIQYSGGADVIDGFNMTDTLHIVDGSVTSAYYTENDDVIINVSGGGKITILEGAEKRLNIKIGDGALMTTVISEAGEDTGSGGGIDYPITLTSGADNASFTDDEATVYAQAGNDTLKISGYYGYYDGGAGNDILSLDGGAEGNTLVGGAGADSIYANGGGNVIVYNTGDGKDTIVGYGENDSLVINGTVTKAVQSGANVLITVGSGTANVLTIKDTTLENLGLGDDTGSGGSELISGTAGADVLSNSKAGVTIDALAGNDTISNTGDEVSISGGGGNDRITNSGSSVSIDAGAGNDTINSSGDEVLIDGGAGADKISLSSSATVNTIAGGAGNDTIYTNGGVNVIVYNSGDGKDMIYGFGGEDSIKITSGTISKTSQSGANVLVTVGSGTSNVITIRDVALSDLSVSGGTISYTDGIIPTPTVPSLEINNTEDYATIRAGSGNHTITNEGHYVYADGGAGLDKIINFGEEVTLAGGDGNDTLFSSGNDGLLDGGAGADKISLEDGASNNTIAGGAGNDTIYTNGAGNIIQYGEGDGSDVIYGFGENDSVEISGSIRTSVQSGGDVLVTVGGSANVLTFKNLAAGNLYVEDGLITYTDEIIEEPDYPLSLTSGKDNETFSDDGATVYALAGNDTIENEGGDSYINGGVSNDLLINFGDRVTLAGEAGNDTLISSGNDGLLDGGAGNDRISLGADVTGNTISAGAGNDTVYTNGAGNLIRYSGGKDVIVGFGESDSIQITSGSLTKVAQNGSNILITIGSSSNVLTIKDMQLDGELILDAEGFITSVESEEYPQFLTSGADTLEVSDDEAEVYALAGNDTLKISGNYGYFDGGAGSDKISLDADATGNTLVGGAGADTLYMNGAGNVIQYETGGGKDVIFGFGENDSVELDGEVTKILQSGANVLVTVGSSANVLTFKNISIGNLSVDDNLITYTEEILPEYPMSLTSGADSFTVSDDDATVYALGGKDTITNQGSFSYISGGAGNDILINGGEEVTLSGDAGNDTIYSNGMSNLIQYGTGDGKDFIIGFSDTDSIEITSGAIRSSVQSGANVIIYVGTGTSNAITLKDISLNNLSLEDSVITFREGAVPVILTAKNDSYTNAEDEATIDALAGNDTLSNSGSYVSISGNTGNDKITNTGNLVTLEGGAGNDTIITNGDTALIDGGAGTDKISLGADAGNVTINAGADNDTIYSNGSGNVIQFGSGDGKDTVFGFSGEDSIQITAGTVSKSVQSGANVLVTVGSSSNVLTIRDAQISRLAIEDNIISAFDMTKYLTEKADTTLVSDNNIQVEALGGNDRITLTGSEVTISGGEGNDTVIVDNDCALIDGGAGADRVSLSENAMNATVIGGAGNDSIYSGGGSNLFIYEAGDGADTILGFTRGDSISVSGANVGTPTWSGANATFQIGSGKIVLRNVANEEFKISGGIITLSDEAALIKGSERADTISNTITGARIDALAGNDKIYNSGNEVSIYGGAGADLISLSSGAEDVTISGGAGADTIYSNGNGNLISYAAGDGKDVIFGFGGADSVEITGGSVSKSVQSGANVLVTVGSAANVLTFKNTTLAELVVDDNFIYGRNSNGARLDDICAENYSVTNLETGGDFKTIAQSDFLTLTTNN
ncbi:MAG: hypothetical protein J5809_03115 [Selenomonadaceae bacterium]|nr:hypothetical protein [Selenomonadaceae bacterium]